MLGNSSFGAMIMPDSQCLRQTSPVQYMTTIQAGAEPRTALPGGRQRPSTGSRSFIARSRPRGTNTSGCRSGCQESRQHLASDSATARSARCPNTLPATSIGPTTTPQSLRHSIEPTSPKRHSDKTTARHGMCYRVRDGSSFDADLCSVSEGDSPNLLR